MIFLENALPGFLPTPQKILLGILQKNILKNSKFGGEIRRPIHETCGKLSGLTPSKMFYLNNFWDSIIF